MYFSRHNIISKIAESEQYILINILTGNADILPVEEVLAIEKGIFSNPQEYTDKGYLAQPAEEEKLFRQKYIEFIENRDTDEVQLFFVTNYSCNFSCSYCYQDEYQVSPATLSTEIIDAFFEYIVQSFRNRKKYITLFGGEPLLPGANHKNLIEYIVQKAAAFGIEIAVVTNGFHLAEYLQIFNKGKIREIQVTLDGVGEIHDIRRPLKNGGSTFQQIVNGIDMALLAEFPVNLRMVVDKQNIGKLPDMATFAADKGWTSNPLFKTQLGRNYELHHCQVENQNLYSRVSLYEKLFKLIKEFPHILDFHRPAFSVSKFLFEEGRLPSPVFDSCPATKTEWAFDYTGKIYACTATVGKAGEELGRFYPHVILNQEKISEWEERDILSIDKCKECTVQLACGGGCAAVAKNNSGTIGSPDCRPARELIGLGTGLYFKDIVNSEQ